MTRCLISCGANISSPFGKPLETLKVVFKELPKEELIVLKKSRFYSSKAFPDPKQPEYLNGCLQIEVDCEAVDVLARLKRIEIKMGRQESSRWGVRTCDLDLLSFDTLVQPNKEIFNQWLNMPLRKQLRVKPSELLLPHPRIQDRAFVLKPLLEVAADWIHPVLNLSVREMFESLPKEERDSVLLT